MDTEEVKKIQIEWSKITSEIRSKAKISECFYYNHSECKGIIKKAHSIQQNGRLSLLEEDVNGNSSIYSFAEEYQLNDITKKPELKPIGKGSASTFMGFCDYHDKALFSEIEDKPFIDNEERCFLYSYRAFAHTHHKKTEQIKAFQSDSRFNKMMPSTLIADLLKGTINGYIQGEQVRKRLNEIFAKHEYDELDSLTIILPDFYPIASCASFTPKYSPKSNTKLNINPKIPYEDIFFNLIPDKSGTIVIFSCLPEKTKSIKYIDDFDSLSALKQQQILTSIIIGDIGNTYISPHIYNKLTEKEKDILLDELKKTAFLTNYQSRHFLSKLNLFEPRFIK